MKKLSSKLKFRPFLKRARSCWPRGFSNKVYPVIGWDILQGERLFILQTGENPEIDYQLVYPDEGVIE